jgi:hypothetical protein
MRDIGLEGLHQRVSREGNGNVASGRRERSCLRQQCISDDGSCAWIAVGKFGSPQPITAIKVLEITALSAERATADCEFVSTLAGPAADPEEVSNPF